MQHTVTYDASADLIRVTATGRPEAAGFRAVMDACAEIYDAKACRRMLNDYRGLDSEFDHITVPVLADLAEHAAALAATRNPFASAIICVDGTQFALTRVWEVLAARPELEVRYKVFLDAQEARRWLDSAEPARPAGGAGD